MGEPGVADSQSRYKIILHDEMYGLKRTMELVFFLIEWSLVRGCVCPVLCHEEVMKER